VQAYASADVFKGVVEEGVLESNFVEFDHCKRDVVFFCLCLSMDSAAGGVQQS
jgi:hypothetical protein